MAWSVQAAMASLKERKKKIEIKAKSRRNARGDCIKERTVRRAPHMIENPAFRHAARVLAFPTSLCAHVRSSSACLRQIIEIALQL